MKLQEKILDHRLIDGLDVTETPEPIHPNDIGHSEHAEITIESITA